jgi:hypothetical protein
MTKEEIYKEVEKDLLTHFDAKVLMPMYERLAVIIMESTIKAINYTRCCESDSELLSKRPNTSSTWECFTKADKQKKGNI